MASAHSDGPGSICLVANDLDHVVRNSGMGTYYSLLAPLLVKAGWRVHILYLGTVDDPRGLVEAPIKLRRQGVSFSLLSDFETPEMIAASRRSWPSTESTNQAPVFASSRPLKNSIGFITST